MIHRLVVLLCTVIVPILLVVFSNTVLGVEGAKQVAFYGYPDCIELSNATTKAVLCPAAGGRILSYAVGEKNVLYLPPGDEGWTWDGQAGGAPMNAGRCDIGPPTMVPQRDLLWRGRWAGEILGDRKAILRSQSDRSTGVRLERTFELDAHSSRLRFTQNHHQYQHGERASDGRVLSLEPYVCERQRDMCCAGFAAQPVPEILCPLRSARQDD